MKSALTCTLFKSTRTLIPASLSGKNGLPGSSREAEGLEGGVTGGLSCHRHAAQSGLALLLLALAGFFPDNDAGIRVLVD